MMLWGTHGVIITQQQQHVLISHMQYFHNIDDL